MGATLSRRRVGNVCGGVSLRGLVPRPTPSRRTDMRLRGGSARTRLRRLRPGTPAPQSPTRHIESGRRLRPLRGARYRARAKPGTPTRRGTEQSGHAHTAGAEPRPGTGIGDGARHDQAAATGRSPPGGGRGPGTEPRAAPEGGRGAEACHGAGRGGVGLVSRPTGGARNRRPPGAPNRPDRATPGAVTRRPRPVEGYAEAADRSASDQRAP